MKEEKTVFSVKILTPKKEELFEARSIEIPTNHGDFVIQKNHAPIVSSIATEQNIIIHTQKKEVSIASKEGIIWWDGNIATITIVE